MSGLPQGPNTVKNLNPIKFIFFSLEMCLEIISLITLLNPYIFKGKVLSISFVGYFSKSP